MRRNLVSIGAAALCLGYFATGHAGQVSQPMNVSLTIGAPGGEVSLIVGSLILTGPTNGPAIGTASVRVTATANLPYAISLNPGLNMGPSSLSRSLLGSGGLLPYYLYRDPSTGDLWGEPGNPVLGPPVNGLGTGSEQAYTVHAATSSYQGMVNGAYTDVVTVRVDF